jgi:hypothetical protein
MPTTNRDASAYIKEKAVVLSAVADLNANALKPKGTLGGNIAKPPAIFVPQPPPPFIFREERFPNREIIAGVENDGNSSVNGIGTNAKFNSIVTAYRIDNIIYVVDRNYFHIRKFNILTNEVTTYISKNTTLSPTITTNLLFEQYPNCVTHDPIRNFMYIGQSGNILKVDMNTNTISELVSIQTIADMCVSLVYHDNNLYFVDPQQSVIYRVNLTNNAVTLLAGTKRSAGYENDLWDGTRAKFNLAALYDSCLTIDNARNLYLADRNNNAIRRINIDSTRVTTFLTLSAQAKCVYYDSTERALYFSEGPLVKKISMLRPFFFIPTMDTLGGSLDLGGFIVVNRNLMYLITGRSVIYKLY